MPLPRLKKGFVCNNIALDLSPLNADWAWCDFGLFGDVWGDMDVVMSLDRQGGSDAVTTPNIETWIESPNYHGWFQVGNNETDAAGENFLEPEDAAELAMEHMDLALAADPKAHFALGRMTQYASLFGSDYFWDMWDTMETSYKQRVQAVSVHYYTQAQQSDPNLDNPTNAYEKVHLENFLRKTRKAMDKHGLQRRQIWVTESGLYGKDYDGDNETKVVNYPKQVHKACLGYAHRWAWFIQTEFTGMYHLQMSAVDEEKYPGLDIGDLTPIGDTFAAI